jgi:hypothetical protein
MKPDATLSGVFERRTMPSAKRFWPRAFLTGGIGQWEWLSPGCVRIFIVQVALPHRAPISVAVGPAICEQFVDRTLLMSVSSNGC